MKVAFFTDSYRPTPDGVAQVTGVLADDLARRGVDVTVYTVSSPGERARTREPAGTEVRRCPSVAAPRYPQYRVAVLPFLRAAGGARRERPDVVHVHTPGFVGLAGLRAARAWGTPLVSTFHTDLAGMLDGRARSPATAWFYERWGEFNRWLCWKADAATAPTPAAAARLAEGSPPGIAPIRVIPNGVDTRRFRPGVNAPDWPRRLAPGAAELPALVTFLGRLTVDKGVHRFLDAVALLPRDSRVRFVVGGVGPEEAAVRRRLSDPSLAGRVVLVGRVPEAEKPALLAQSRVFVLPSTSDTSSVALLEALACGAACVVTDRGGPADIARESGAALVVDPERPGSVAEAVSRILASETLSSELGQRGRAWVSANADATLVTGRFLGLYEELLESGVRPRRD